MVRPDVTSLLDRIDRYCDAAPRAEARTETVGPFTLFMSTGGSPSYARPRIGLSAPIGPVEVTDVCARQRALGLPEALEWLVETAPPSLAVAARACGLEITENPVLVLERPIAAAAPTGIRVRRVTADDPELDRITAVAAVGFAHAGTAIGPAGPKDRDLAAAGASASDRTRLRERLAAGLTVTMVAEGRDGPVATGSHQPVGGVTEIVGVATLPSARRHGIGAALTAALAGDALGAGVELVFLSAAGDDVARIYERLGFRRVARAGVAGVPAE